jgi:hypothetical protein
VAPAAAARAAFEEHGGAYAGPVVKREPLDVEYRSGCHMPFRRLRRGHPPFTRMARLGRSFRCMRFALNVLLSSFVIQFCYAGFDIQFCYPGFVTKVCYPSFVIQVLISIITREIPQVTTGMPATYNIRAAARLFGRRRIRAAGGGLQAAYNADAINNDPKGI